MAKGKLIRMDNVSIVVDDLDPVIAFFSELGLKIEGKATVEGESVDRLIALDNVKSDIVMMRMPDGHGGIELSQFHSPKAIGAKKNTSVNTLGMGRIMFAVEDLHEVVARLRKVGGELFGEVVQYGDSYILCYVRGPQDIVIALAEELH
jgi:catechol 2,3-dioxygenase-like lactoylglutathione lyase family enzyme